MIRHLWLFPPLAIARLGRSKIPCDNFVWGPNDLSPRGTGKTTIIPTETLNVSEDGSVTASIPREITFKDEDGWKRVCPFFELHGEWIDENGKISKGPITPEILKIFGNTSHELKWKVHVANLKAFHYTKQSDDKVEACVNLDGDLTTSQPLNGSSPKNSQKPLISPGKFIDLGNVQLTKPRDENDIFRLRFTPAHGRVYGPTNINDRLTGKAVEEQLYKIDPERRILNPDAHWCNFNVDKNTNENGVIDRRTIPSGEYPVDKNGISLGIMDDICDGIISCSLGNLTAFARVTVGPPKVNPDRRHFTSLADGLKDRFDRDDVCNPQYVLDTKQTSLEISDFMERIRETVDAMNVDAQNERARFENMDLLLTAGFVGDIIKEAGDKAFPLTNPKDEISGRPFPLTEIARRNHRRFVSLEVFDELLREHPEVINERIRKPSHFPQYYYDQKMPVGMRGSDGYPMSITQRQYDLLLAYQKWLREEAEE